MGLVFLIESNAGVADLAKVSIKSNFFAVRIFRGFGLEVVGWMGGGQNGVNLPNPGVSWF